jgi:hypothetical protein
MFEAVVVEVTSDTAPNRLPVAKLIYDDEPLDDLLYNQASICPSEVSVFDQAKKFCAICLTRKWMCRRTHLNIMSHFSKLGKLFP